VIRKRIETALLIVAALFVLVQAAVGAETKATSARPQYKKVTGDVVSVSPSAIVVKSKVKGDMTLAVTASTDLVNGKAAKAGDRVRVNYRADKSGKTATRIEVLSATGATSQGAAPKTATAAPAAKTAK
jgi:hypothetical protein